MEFANRTGIFTQIRYQDRQFTLSRDAWKGFVWLRRLAKGKLEKRLVMMSRIAFPANGCDLSEVGVWMRFVSGGIASLNRWLMAWNPSGSRGRCADAF
jgi:hypothetical protein